MEKLEVFGSTPAPRFGHTITLISKTKAILFGGATGDTNKYSITADVYSFDLTNKLWKKLETIGAQPSCRAAHSAAGVEGNQVVIYGGAAGGTSGSLASDDLYLLDLKNGEASAAWTIVPVVGPTPGRRYGHTMTYSKPYITIFGGNTGTEAVNDVWCLNVEKAPFAWQKIDCKGECPTPRVYHSAALCNNGTAAGMMVIFGGRGGDQAALNDTWGLRKHRNGTWSWVKAPNKSEKDQVVARYQHSSLFVGTLMIVLGGRNNNLGENVGVGVYDTETSEWYKLTAVQRFRHVSWVTENYLYVQGGFDPDLPNTPLDTLIRLDLLKVLQPIGTLHAKVKASTTPAPPSEPVDTHLYFPHEKPSVSIKESTSRDSSNSRSPRSFRMDNTALLASSRKSPDRIVRRVQTNRIQEEAESLRQNELQNRKVPNIPPVRNASDPGAHMVFLEKLMRPKNYVCPNDNAIFDFPPELIHALCDQAQFIIENQPIVLKVDAPIKIFGDIHGQYSDLMRFFDLYGTPCDGLVDEDIESFDYLFLGDYVDRGMHSLETICCLLALKVRYPEQVHLLRGNHEDRWINNGFGFSDECADRLGENPDDDASVFKRINLLFDYLPLAAVVEDQVLCVHGGIGSNLTKVEEIFQIERPLEVVHVVETSEQQLVVDILWSDPTDSDAELGIQPNIMRDPSSTGHIVKYGPDVASKFLANNNLRMIIRAHECVMDGFERFAAGQLITIFSATDYCRRHKNAGAVLILKKDLEIIPKLIYPQNSNQHNWIEDDKQRPATPPRWRALPRKSS
jgi:diadenosine tetraphosphatase ApaH/serine/threonine PP2A family protein phosphatase